MFAARTTHSYTNQISATLYLFPCVHMPLRPHASDHLPSPVPALVVPDSRTSRVPIASRLPAHLRNLSSSLAPALRVVFVPSPASCLVLSLRRHSSNASDVQVLALRGPGSSSSLVALFFGLGLPCMSVRDSCFWFNTPYFVLTVLLCASRVWTPNPVFGRPPHRPDPAPLRPGHFFGVRHGRGQRGGRQPPLL